MISDILSVYPKDDSYLILNPQVPAWIVTNASGLAVIKEYGECLSAEKTASKIHSLNGGIPKEAVVRFLKHAEDASLFKEVAEASHVHKPYFLNALYLNMTQSCNLRCSYCFATTRKENGHEQLQVQEYKAILNDAKAVSNGRLDIVLTGGEPLLCENTIPVAKYAKELGATTRLLTNATLISESNVQELCETFDFFKISMDGSSEQLHDRYRGAGSWVKTVHAIELLGKYKANVQIAMTVTRENIGDIPAMNKRWGSMLAYQPLFPLGRAKDNHVALTGKEYYEALCTGENINPFSDIANIIKAHKSNGSVMKCSMGDGELSVSCTDDVYPCQLLHHDEFYLGNVHDQTFAEIYRSEKCNSYKMHTISHIDKCRSCDFRYLCGGACQARHYSETGSLDKAGDFCEYERLGIVHGIISSCKMVEV